MSASTNALIDALRTRLLTFVPMGGQSLSMLGVEAYLDAPPRSAAATYLVLSLSSVIDANDSTERQQLALEVQCFGRLRADEGLVNTYADIADEAFLRWNGNGAQNGVLFSRDRTRQVLPQLDDPAAREEYRIRCLYALVSWPNFLTQYANS